MESNKTRRTNQSNLCRLAALIVARRFFVKLRI